MTTISNNSSPNFTGKYIKQVKVMKNNLPENVSLIELSSRDLFDIERVHEKWNTKISNLIAKSFYFPLVGAKNQKVYAVSTQNTNFQKLMPHKVLGMFEVSDRGDCFALEYLDVNPRFRKNYDGTRKTKTGYTQIGKACVDYVRSMFTSKEVEVIPVDEAIPFYEKMGCKKAPKGEMKTRLVL